MDDSLPVGATRATPAGRAEAWQALGAAPFDVLVVGGGITGAGVARDAALRGLRTALVEQADFASGTSSRSSRLVHGGVRYLEHGELGLVFESSAERRTLQRIAPHLVRPLAFTWPVYAGARVPRWKLAAGLTLYDLLALFRNVGRHERLNVARVLAREPRLRTEALLGGARYWDAATDDSRLTLATARSAIAAGAVVLNHARVVSLAVADGRVTGARVIDASGGASTEVSARVVVNAAGPWSDTVERMAHGTARPAVRGSKGVHVNVPHARIGNTGALTLLAPSDGRVMFVLPAGEFTIIGTTDTYETVDPDQVRASEADVSYLLDAANHFFPSARLVREDVVSAWAGLRPLKAEGDAGDPSAASREHAIAEQMPGLVTVTGGKLTTYRAMAREVVDAVERSMGRRRSQARTSRLPLAGGSIGDVAGAISEAAALVGDGAVATRLVHAHGDAWREVWALAAADPALRERVDADRPYLLAELAYAVRHELALTLGDLLIRRVPLAFETRDHGRSAARRVAAPVASWRRWSAVEMRAAIAEYDAEVERMFRVEPRGAR
ncbi:MAG: glycerol-3-phosphate dehydrogenase/oxidase [Gemmatimonadaceae bacterium]|nr:glycerol-3-phosphate dehydrogenase/oxidase [Gemmatimonadaceae bacterium]NUO92881.1 glycerol-3-phosphate dehydrogenase/oxidase [Gemmatimonadaceae bacterium]NUP71089.1 glycerol-3-phosphate dehydrogenase/oxidase [Gemmatimonadaceae bacterium]NUR36244.1 glycerol-3-phosphate dehydrogenase/oxidase [Gemmatimonadaceae bacterium]NUS32935.1 glycerol-3-phosphate dehydrogenase/oxidase [Gemmatimonadaceae bacterium]